MAGDRKYLTAAEFARFTAAAKAHERAEVRTFCLVLAYTGCRISEALDTTARHVDLDRKTLTFRTLKQRQAIRHRSLPIPLPPRGRTRTRARDSSPAPADLPGP